MVSPPVSTFDRLCHQHVPLVSSPDEDIVRQMLRTRPRTHPGSLLSLQQTKGGVRQDEAVFCAGAEKQQTIVAGTVEIMATQHSSPGRMVCAFVGVEVAKDNQLIRLRHSRQESVQILVEYVTVGVRAGHRRSAGNEDDSEFSSPGRQAEAH
nr:unnamed protein product [Spirometra erinaceieuropaei]